MRHRQVDLCVEDLLIDYTDNQMPEITDGIRATLPVQPSIKDCYQHSTEGLHMHVASYWHLRNLECVLKPDIITLHLHSE